VNYWLNVILELVLMLYVFLYPVGVYTTYKILGALGSIDAPGARETMAGTHLARGTIFDLWFPIAWMGLIAYVVGYPLPAVAVIVAIPATCYAIRRRMIRKFMQ